MTHPFDQLEKHCEKHNRQKVIVSRDMPAGATVITLECTDCERVEMSEPTMTIWNNGTWRLWTATDAHYAANDADWLVNIPLKEIVNYQEPG